jgi:hypothetical protein
MDSRHFKLRVLFLLKISVMLFALFAVSLLLPRLSIADSLDISVVNPSQTVAPNQTVIFKGTVSNNSGVDLSATDLFLNFFGFDPNLTVNQLLGTPDFSILNGTTSSAVNLFSVTLGPGTGTGALPVNFVLQDVIGDLSAPGQVTVVNAVATPEPSSLLLLGTGLSVLLGTIRRRI